jgi:hypothetical protein
VPQGTALTVFVEPSGAATSKPGPVEDRVGGISAGAYAPVYGAGSFFGGVEAAGSGCVVNDGSGIGGGPGSGGG